MAMGWDTALIVGGLSAAGSVAAASMANSANAAQNAFSAEQAGGFFQASQEHQKAERERAQAFNSAEAAAARDFSLGASREQRLWATNEADKARTFEKLMSDTAMQRKVRDLQAAGLNPMLAYQQGGASTPNASAPTGSAAQAAQASISPGSAPGGQVPNRIAMSPVLHNTAGAVSAGLDAGLKEAQADNIRADTMQKLGQTAPTMQQAQLFERQAQDIVKKWDLIDQQINKEAAHASESQHRSDLLVMQQDMTQAMTALYKAQEGVAKGTIPLQSAQAALANVQATAQKYGLDELKAASELWKKLGEKGGEAGDAGMAAKAAILIKQLFK